MAAARHAASTTTEQEADLRRAVATPIQVDIDDLSNEPKVTVNQDSPSKRTRWDVQSQAPLAASGSTSVGTSLTLEQLTAQLSAAMAPQ